MSVEIERKFLVDKGKLDLLAEKVSSSRKELTQGYLAYTPGGTTLRVRTARTEDVCRGVACVKLDAWITIKGETTGISRPEFEWPISYFEAQEMLANIPLEGSLLTKTRIVMVLEDQKWEIDIFHGGNEGLVVAEAEIPHEGADLRIPSFVTREVSDDFRYSNVQLSINPYLSWPVNPLTVDHRSWWESIRQFLMKMFARLRA